MAFFTSAFALSCGGQEPLPAGDEDPIYVEVPAPKEAPLGSLGGICGVDLVKCDTAEKMHAILGPSLKRTSVKSSVKSSNGAKILTISFQVPRLVNDHKESKDKLEIITRFSTNGSDDIDHVVKRNGTKVVESRSYPSLDLEDSHIEMGRGGAEALLAAFGDPRLIEDHFQKHTKAFTAPGSKIDNCAKGQHKRRCRILGGIVATSITFLGGVAAVSTGGIAGVVIGIGAPTFGTAFQSAWACDEEEKADRCEESRCMCSKSQTTAVCHNEFEQCCKAHGGYVYQQQANFYCGY